MDERSCDLPAAALAGAVTAVVSEDFDDAMLSSRSAAADTVAGVASAMTVAPVTRVVRIRRMEVLLLVVRRLGSPGSPQYARSRTKRAHRLPDSQRWTGTGKPAASRQAA